MNRQRPFRATALTLAVALACTADVALAQFVQQQTGAVTLGVYGSGVVGTNVGTGPGFIFDFDQRMFHGQLFAATGPETVVGSHYYTSEWTQVQAPTSSPPPAGFLSALTAQFNDSGAATPIGLSISQRTLARSLAQYIIIEYTVTNTSGAQIDSLYLGLFTDFDVSPSFDDRADFDADRGLLHTYDFFGSNTNRYGILSFHSNGQGISGWTANPSVDPYEALTSPAAGGTFFDVVNAIGTGPYAIAAGADAVIRFAIVAGGSLASIRNQASAAQNLFPTASEDEPTGTRLRLYSVAPNPASRFIILRYGLRELSEVGAALYDVMGRLVASPGTRLSPPGEHQLVVDVGDLASGVYRLQLEAGGDHATRTVTIAR